MSDCKPYKNTCQTVNHTKHVSDCKQNKTWVLYRYSSVGHEVLLYCTDLSEVVGSIYRYPGEVHEVDVFLDHGKILLGRSNVERPEEKKRHVD